MSHTPGPWEVGTPRRADMPRSISTKDGALATVHRDRDSFFDDPTGLANALLIAAAPDLLEALRDALRIAKAASIGVTGNQPRIARAEAAIAKAEGK